MLTQKDVVDLLRREVTPALGCTEPVCIALAAADAFRIIEGSVGFVSVEMDPGIFKNAFSVAIPGFDQVGARYAAALGACIGTPELGLNLFAGLTDEIRKEATQLVAAGRVSVSIVHDEQNLYCRAEVHTTNGLGVSIIRNFHDHIVFRQANGVTALNNQDEADGTSNVFARLKAMSVADLRRLVESLDTNDVAFMKDGAEMNEQVALVPTDFGIGIAKSLTKRMAQSLWGDTVQSRIMQRTAACTENRMAGCPLAIMSSAGSGNHGIMTVIPVVELAREVGANDERLCKALAFSHLLNVYIKQFTGKLSALCGCGVSAATAAAGAMTWLLGGNDRQISGAIVNMTGNLTGIICDGGKTGCALKLATASSAALMSACLALDNVTIAPNDGIAAATAEDAIRNMGRVSSPGMASTNKVILAIMLEKEQAAWRQYNAASEEAQDER